MQFIVVALRAIKCMQPGSQTTMIVEGKSSILYFDTADLSPGIFYLHAIQLDRKQGEIIVRQ